MTLLEISMSYDASAAAIRRRIVELRALELAQTDPEAARRLRRRHRRPASDLAGHAPDALRHRPLL